MNGQAPSIPPEERTLAVFTHLSGLAGYVIPLGGILVPVVIWAMKSESPIIARLAKQAVFLNLATFGAALCLAMLLLTVILIPVVFLGWALLGLAAVIVPIVGAVKASEGVYYRYPVVGAEPPLTPPAASAP